MAGERVVISLQTADRTRKAMVTVTTDMVVNDLVKASRARWKLGFAVDYQVFNMSTGRQLLPYEQLTTEVVHPGDALVLQPFASHGRCA